MTHPPTIRLLVLGDRNVGKTAIVVRFLTRRYIGEYSSYPGWIYKKLVTCPDIGVVNLEIQDSTENEEGWKEEKPFELSNELLSWADAYLIVYSICDRKSFERAVDLCAAVRRRRGETVPLLLVGNKQDLAGPARAVTAREAELRATEQAARFAEVSAAESPVGVSASLGQLLREVRGLRNPRSATRKLSIVSSVFGAMFGKHKLTMVSGSGRKRRTSFSL